MTGATYIAGYAHLSGAFGLPSTIVKDLRRPSISLLSCPRLESFCPVIRQYFNNVSLGVMATQCKTVYHH